MHAIIKYLNVVLLCLFLFFFAQSRCSNTDSLLLLLKTDLQDTSRTVHLNALCREYTNTGNYEEALKQGNAALELAKKLDYKKEIASASSNIGAIYYYTGSYDQALENFLASLKVRQLAGDQKGIANSYNNIGLTYQDQGNYGKALETFLLSLHIRREAGDKAGQAISFNNLGRLYSTLGNYQKALENHLAALKIRAELGDRSGLAASYNNIGVIYLNLGKDSMALQEHLAALNIWIETGNRSGVADVYNNIGSIYLHGNDLDKALENFIASRKIKQEIGDKPGMATSYINIGEIYRKKHATGLALHNYTTALQLLDSIGDPYRIAGCYNSIAMVHADRSNFSQALAWLNKSLDLQKNIRSKQMYMDTYEALAEVSGKAGDTKRAFSYQLLFSKYKDSIFNEQSMRQMAQLQAEYESTKQQQQIDLLEKEKKIRSLELTRQEDEIRQQKFIRNAAMLSLLLLFLLGWILYQRKKLKEKAEQERNYAELEMKALRSRMNPHFIFNSLASIQQFIYSQKPDEANDYLSRFSRLIRMIFDHSQEKNIPLADDIEGLKLYMELEQLRLDHKFDFVLRIEPGLDPAEIKIPPLIIQPFVENAIWHGISALEKKGTVEISIAMEPSGKSDVLQCIVKDNGVGRHPEKEKRATGIPEHRSKGMSITRERLKIFNAMNGSEKSLEIIDLYTQNHKPAGTEVHIFIPVSI